MATEVVGSARRLIPRPRLTTLLDENPARIKLLVAPAGYGKTTLAREWLGESGRRSAWYRGGPASADVAALAAGLAVAASEIVPGAGRRMRERIRATGQPEEEVEILAELFAEDLQEWPEDAWLVIDDYQEVMESHASEHFVGHIGEATAVNLLLTSRRRPAWATARRILYSEIQEVDRRELTMSDMEAGTMLAGRGPQATTVIERARGWPAVLGLAAATEHLEELNQSSTLEQFVVDEVLTSASPRAIRAASQLWLAPDLSKDIAQIVLGSEAGEILSELDARGIIAPISSQQYSFHPLIEQHFVRKRESLDSSANIVRAIVDHHLTNREWDQAFAATVQNEKPDLIPEVLAAAIDDLLSSGRLITLTRWIDLAAALRLTDPWLDLAEAELAFRLSDHSRAEQLAAQAASHLDDPPARVRAHLRAGYAAVLGGNELAATSYFRSAHDTAIDAEQRREALLGAYYAAAEFEHDVRPILKAAAALTDDSPHGQLRWQVMQLVQAARLGDVGEAADQALRHAHLLSRIDDPMVKTSFLHALSYALIMNSRYEATSEFLDEFLSIAKRFRLDFAIRYALLDRAKAEIGQRDFSDAEQTLEEVSRNVPTRDTFVSAAADLATAELLMSQREHDKAAATLMRTRTVGLTPPVRTEIAALRSLIAWSRHDVGSAAHLLAEAERIGGSSIEAAVLTTSARALLAADDLRYQQLWQAVKRTGNTHTFVCICRSAPLVTESVRRATQDDSALQTIFLRSNDVEVMTKAGLLENATDKLTPREYEVAALLRLGLSNGEIATRLVVSPSTVKVHVRHIYEKLGVKNRAQAVARLG